MDGPVCAERAEGAEPRKEVQDVKDVKLVARVDCEAEALTWKPNDGVLRVLYLYSGAPRQEDVKGWLTKLCEKDPGIKGLVVHCAELGKDGKGDDLSEHVIQDRYIQRVEAGFYDVVIASPPCGSFTRIVWTNSAGPPPCRSSGHPFGFPWADASSKARA